MPSVDNCDDPWQTPAAEVDAEVLETSQRLVEKSDSQWPQTDLAPPNPDLELAQQKITELELQQKRIFQRNVRLTAEIAQLRATNQRLIQELAQRPQPAKKQGWWQRLFGG